MGTRLETIKGVLKTKLEGISHLRHVYDYDKADPEGYPFGVVVPSNWEGEFGDFSAISKRNLRTWNFNVKVFVERDEASFGPEKAERVATEAVDEILTAFDFDVTLSGTVKQVSVVGGDFDIDIIGNTVKVASLDISCLDLVEAR